jgi:hypothetical protein
LVDISSSIVISASCEVSEEPRPAPFSACANGELAAGNSAVLTLARDELGGCTVVVHPLITAEARTQAMRKRAASIAFRLAPSERKSNSSN